MKTCIITIIKDEQPYLEQWIKYHINIGIDTFFIYEDFFSSSHREICDKFPQVQLNSVSALFKNEHDVEWAIDKRKKCIGLQHVYQPAAVCKVMKTDYDWVFIMDVDEYITLSDNSSENSLQNTLSLYSDYGAVVLYWKNFGANNLVHSPKFPYSLVDTYTKPTGFSDYDFTERKITKIAYNVKHIRKTYKNHHFPKPNSNWCYTDFTRDKSKICYDRMYIRHYITKSFDEYLWKLNTRGMFYKHHRDINEFFVYNPEMRNNTEIQKIINTL